MGIFSKILRSKKKPASRYEFYPGCRELLLDGFISYMTTRKPEALCRKGVAPADEAAEHWEILYAEYCTLVGLQSYQELFGAYKEIARLRSNMMIIETALLVLNMRPSEICASSLCEIGYKYTEGKDRLKQLDLIAKKSKNLSILIKIKQKEIDAIVSRSKGTVSEADIRKGIASLSKYMGIRVDTSIVTVYEYAMMQRLMQEEINNKVARDHGRKN